MFLIYFELLFCTESYLLGLLQKDSTKLNLSTRLLDLIKIDFINKVCK